MVEQKCFWRCFQKSKRNRRNSNPNGKSVVPSLDHGKECRVQEVVGTSSSSSDGRGTLLERKIGIKDITDNDRNIAYFHSSVVSKRNKLVSRLRLSNEWTYNKSEIHERAIDHFQI